MTYFAVKFYTFSCKPYKQLIIPYF